MVYVASLVISNRDDGGAKLGIEANIATLMGVDALTRRPAIRRRTTSKLEAAEGFQEKLKKLNNFRYHKLASKATCKGLLVAQGLGYMG